MGLAGDIVEVREHWSRLSLPMKLVSCLLLLGQFLSVASIGDMAFEFRGFLENAARFFDWMLSPIFELLVRIAPFPIYKSQFVAAVLITIILTTNARARYIINPPEIVPTTTGSLGRKRRARRRNGRNKIFRILGESIYVIIIIGSYFFFMGRTGDMFARLEPEDLQFYLGITLLSSFIQILIDSLCRARRIDAVALLSAGYLAGVILLVGSVAAVSEGFTRQGSTTVGTNVEPNNTLNLST